MKLKNKFLKEQQKTKSKPKIIVPEVFNQKVRYLCNVISEVEWSGILLYTSEGTIKDPENMVITLKDIILMDKGNKTGTDYDFNEGGTDRHIEYCEENEDALGWNIGHIHSHNSMGVFFSGTDMSELKDNAKSHNFYLSVIVNNAMDCVAKVGISSTNHSVYEENFSGFDENGDPYPLGKKNIKVTHDFFKEIDCEVSLNKEGGIFDKFFTDNVEDVLSKSNYSASYNPPHTQHYWGTGFENDQSILGYHSQGITMSKHWSAAEEEEEKKGLLGSVEKGTIEDMIFYIINGNPRGSNFYQTLDSMFQRLDRNDVSFEDIEDRITNSVDIAFYKILKVEDSISQEEVISVLEQITDTLEEYAMTYPLASKCHEFFEVMLNEI